MMRAAGGLALVAVVVVVHLATGLGAWAGVGLLADDHQMVGGAALRHGGVWSLAEAFCPPAPTAGAPPLALYRPFIDLAFWLEQPWFGIEPLGYHVVNSALHCGTALAWFLLVRRWTGSAAAATATALLFAGWPGHSEVTHWIAARTNVLSTFVLSVALLVHDAALARTGWRRGAALLAAAGLAVVAVGAKESALLVVPVAAAIAWQRAAPAPWPRRARAAAGAVLPMALATFAWLAWRAHCLGTWGSGTHYGWKAHRIDGDTCTAWVRALLAPSHHAYVPGAATWAMTALHVGLLVAAVLALRAPAERALAWRRAALPGAVLLALGYVAGIGLEVFDPATLENVRYTYEPALGLCVLMALGLAALPVRARLPLLIAAVLLHAFVLDRNRQSWLRVAANYAHLHERVLELARTSGAPVRVLDAPGVHDGAFGFLNQPTEFTFWQQTAPPGTELRGGVSSTVEWAAVLHELAAAALAGRLPLPTWVARWTDGEVVPFALDPQWPAEPWPGVVVDYARTARERPFVGDTLPVQVLLRSDRPLAVRVAARAGALRWLGAAVPVAAGPRPQPLQLQLALPASLSPGEPVAVELVVEQAPQPASAAQPANAPPARAARFPLGDVVPAVR